MADGSELPAGKENTAGYYDPDEHVVNMHSLAWTLPTALEGLSGTKPMFRKNWMN